MEKAKRKLESDLKQTQETVEDLEKIKRDLEDTGKKWVGLRILQMYIVSDIEITYR